MVLQVLEDLRKRRFRRARVGSGRRDARSAMHLGRGRCKERTLASSRLRKTHRVEWDRGARAKIVTQQRRRAPFHHGPRLGEGGSCTPQYSGPRNASLDRPSRLPAIAARARRKIACTRPSRPSQRPAVLRKRSDSASLADRRSGRGPNRSRGELRHANLNRRQRSEREIGPSRRVRARSLASTVGRTPGRAPLPARFPSMGCELAGAVVSRSARAAPAGAKARKARHFFRRSSPLWRNSGEARLSEWRLASGPALAHGHGSLRKVFDRAPARSRSSGPQRACTTHKPRRVA